jgi:DNA-binding GntR family transcriptional regulator
VSPTTGQRHRDLVDDLAGRMHSEIIAGEVPVGSWLRQENLAEQFGVSRTPVREALRVLHAAGVVTVVPHRGALVRGPTTREIREAYVVRAELEGLGAQLAALNASESDLEALAEASEIFTKATGALLGPGRKRREERQAAWSEANNRFHEAVLRAAGNSKLRQLVVDLHRTFPRNLTWAAIADEPTLIEDNVHQHERVRAAIEAADPEAARRWMGDHVRRAGDLVADWFEQISRQQEAEDVQAGRAQDGEG